MWGKMWGKSKKQKSPIALTTGFSGVFVEVTDGLLTYTLLNSETAAQLT